MSRSKSPDKLIGTSNTWERLVCEGQEIPAKILHYMRWLDTQRRNAGHDPELRFTEEQIINQALGRFGSRTTVRKWMRWFDQRGIFTIVKKTHQKLPGGYPDRASYIKVNAEVIARLKTIALENTGTERRVMSPNSERVPLVNVDQWQSQVGKSCKSQEREQLTEDLPLVNVDQLSGTMVSGTKDPLNPLQPEAQCREVVEEKIPIDSMGTPSVDILEESEAAPAAQGERETRSRKQGRPARGQVWRVSDNFDELPTDPTLRDFASHQWCVAICGFLNIQVVMQAEARLFLSRIRNGRFNCRHYLYVQFVMAAKKRPHAMNLRQLCDFLESEFKSDATGYSIALDELREGLCNQLQQSSSFSVRVGDELIDQVRQYPIDTCARRMEDPADLSNLIGMTAAWRNGLQSGQHMKCWELAV